ncbi:MAG: hypothetical protein PHF70_14710 [Opitutales bacterium]|nr:hypothetical protein [Opitutales bacterium]
MEGDTIQILFAGLGCEGGGHRLHCFAGATGEYVIIGTLWSFGLGLAIAWLTRHAIGLG